MKHWICEIKEVGNDRILKPELIGDYDENYCVKWWGLNKPDVEWYKLKEVKDYGDKR